MDYKQFRETNSVSGKDMISALRELYPKYGKATQSMVDNPEKYGVRLLPAAERHLAERFVGEHDGHKVPNRRKPHRLVVTSPMISIVRCAPSLMRRAAPRRSF